MVVPTYASTALCQRLSSSTEQAAEDLTCECTSFDDCSKLASGWLSTGGHNISCTQEPMTDHVGPEPGGLVATDHSTLGWLWLLLLLACGLKVLQSCHSQGARLTAASVMFERSILLEHFRLDPSHVCGSNQWQTKL